MLLNISHCHTDFMKISRFVPTFSTPTPEVANPEQHWLDQRTLADFPVLS
jgi:hypothetical protein